LLVDINLTKFEKFLTLLILHLLPIFRQDKDQSY